jgi:hypothetical protein
MRAENTTRLFDDFERRLYVLSVYAGVLPEVLHGLSRTSQACRMHLTAPVMIFILKINGYGLPGALSG